MDTLFRLATLQSPPQALDNSTTTPTSSSTQNYGYHHKYQQKNDDIQQEGFQPLIIMDDDEDLSSSFSNQPHDHYSPTTPNPQLFDTSTDWASDLLLDASRAIANKDTARLHHLLWLLSELASPYGDTNQKLASYFLRALFTRLNDSGRRRRATLAAAVDRTTYLDTTCVTLLKFQEASPWITFGHAASNGSILEAFDGEPRVHIVDVSNTSCTQWPTLMEALAIRSDEAPHLRLTAVVSGGGTVVRRMMEVGIQMEKFARLMGVPFEFNAVYRASGDLADLSPAEVDVRDGEALAVNCINALHAVSGLASHRNEVVSALLRLNPRIVTVVEEEANLGSGVDTGDGFVDAFEECVRWFRVYFEALDGCFPVVSNERLALERAAGRAMLDLVACPAAESTERREPAASWSRRMRAAGFGAAAFSEEVDDDIRALLTRYKERGRWTLSQSSDTGMFLCWKDQPVVWASAWRPRHV